MQCQNIHLPSTVSEEVFTTVWGKLRAQYPYIPEELLLVVPRNHALLVYLCQVKLVKCGTCVASMYCSCTDDTRTENVNPGRCSHSRAIYSGSELNPISALSTHTLRICLGTNDICVQLQEFTAAPQRPSDMASVLKFVTTTLSTQLLPAVGLRASAFRVC